MKYTKYTYFDILYTQRLLVDTFPPNFPVQRSATFSIKFIFFADLFIILEELHILKLSQVLL